MGEPLHCSGLISPRTLALAGVGNDIVRNEIHRARVHLPNGASASFGGERIHALVVDRIALDRALVAQAQAAGAELALATRLQAIHREGEQVRLTLTHDGRSCSMTTKLLIGADGAQSTVARWLGASTATDRVVGVSAEVPLDLPNADEVQLFVGSGVAPRFFDWAIPEGHGTARIGVATQGELAPGEYLQRLREAFPNVLGGIELRPMYGGVIPLTRIHQPFADNVMLVGDAAGQVKPTSGGGIHAALLAARHAAATAIEALETGDLSAERLSAYAEAWEAELGAEFDRMTELRRVFLSLSDQELERLVSLLTLPRLRAIVEQHGDIDFPSRAVERLAQPLVLTFLRLGLKLPLGRLIHHAPALDSTLTGLPANANVTPG